MLLANDPSPGAIFQAGCSQRHSQKFFGSFFQKRTKKEAALVLCACGLLAWFADWLVPPLDLSRASAASTEVLARDGRVLADFPSPGGMWRLRTSVDDVDPRYLSLLVAVEDRHFFIHGGVDGAALLRAAWQFLRVGHVVSGGSTLSMQTARLLRPHARGVFGKLHDIAWAIQLERRFTKNQILGLYLTLAPFGGNIEGVRAASLAWFGHSPAHLSQAEASLLVAIPQSPARRRPDRHLADAQAAAARLLERVDAAGMLPEGWLPKPVFPTSPLPRHDLPHDANLFCASLARQAPAGAVIKSTIDAALQMRLEALVARETQAEPVSVGVAAMVLDNASREILASVGGRGPGFAGADLDLTARRRSPGSALKPFIYGMAFDDGTLHPLTLIGDAPGLIRGYAPHNFDYFYHGAVTAQTALRQSFNVPAVQVLDRVGPDRFVSALRQAGAKIALPGRQASLAVALGGLGISLSDMVMLYAALGNDGQAALPVRRLGDHALRRPFMGPLAIFYLRQILQGSPPPPGMAYALMTGSRPIAFKTGTSYGFRDAWAIGTSSTATIGVWTGRVEGTPRPGAFGRATAAPLMLDVFALLPPETPGDPQPPPGAILAATTGELPLSLRRLGPDRDEPGRPTLAYPPSGATIDLLTTPTGGFLPVTLHASGGTLPLRWVINGAPVVGSTADLPWQPDGPGMANVTIIDAEDRSVTGTFRLLRSH
jgi:penicillin-binding protein 1C